MAERRFRLLVTSDMLSAKHIVQIDASNLGNFKSRLLEAVGLSADMEQLQLEAWDAEFKEFVLLNDISLVGDKAKVKISQRIDSGGASPRPAVGDSVGVDGGGGGGGGSVGGTPRDSSASVKLESFSNILGSDVSLSGFPSGIRPSDLSSSERMSDSLPGRGSAGGDVGLEGGMWSMNLYGSADAGGALGRMSAGSAHGSSPRAAGGAAGSAAAAGGKTKKPKKPKRKKTPQEEGLESVNTGTWTDEEKRLFVEGLQKYGKDWPEIQKRLIRTRTLAQIRSHAQKFFLKWPWAKEFWGDGKAGALPPGAPAIPAALAGGAAADSSSAPRNRSARASSTGSQAEELSAESIEVMGNLLSPRGSAASIDMDAAVAGARFGAAQSLGVMGSPPAALPPQGNTVLGARPRTGPQGQHMRIGSSDPEMAKYAARQDKRRTFGAAGAAPPAPPGHARAHKPRRQPSGDLNLSGLGLSADGGSFDFAVADIFTGQRDQSMEIPYAGPGGRASVPSGLGAGAGGGAASGAPGAESRRQNSGVGDLMGDIIDGRNRSTSTDDMLRFFSTGEVSLGGTMDSALGTDDTRL